MARNKKGRGQNKKQPKEEKEQEKPKNLVGEKAHGETVHDSVPKETSTGALFSCLPVT